MTNIGVFENLINREPWTDGALCSQVDVGDLFFPEKGELAKPAKRICARCDVRVECLAFAVRNDIRYGVYGGLSARDRTKLGRTA